MVGTTNNPSKSQENFGEDVKNLRSTSTPGTPGFVGAKTVEEEDKISTEEKSIYRSGVGTLLYLTKHS